MIDAHLSALAETALAARGAKKPAIEAAAAAVATAVRAGNKVLAFGNGGSATQAQHFAAELVVRYKGDRPGLSAVALVCDGAILTACANDYSYDYVFARQVEALGQAGDVFIAISTSGNSPNILRAADAARARGIRVIGFTGESGGKLAPLADICFRMPSSETPRIQEGHELFGHMLCALVESEMYPRDAG